MVRHSNETRLRAIMAVWWDGLDYADAAAKVSCADRIKVSPAWVGTVYEHYELTGETEAPVLTGHAPANQKMTWAAATQLIDILLDSPEALLVEHHSEFEAETGVHVHYSTFCKAVHALGFTRRKLQQYAAGRDALAVARFRAKVARWQLKASMMLAVDETSKDGRSLRRTFGYAMRGMGPPIGASGLLPRGMRTSALCSFDVAGFVAWEFTEGTYNAERFLDAAERVILEHVGVFPGPRSVVLIDNASIHKSVAFLQAVNARGAMVLFTPPYAWDTQPLDITNGGFSQIKQWLQNASTFIAEQGWSIEETLDQGFRGVVSAAGARAAFRNAGYAV